jgi:hypothetical protein
MVFFHRKREGRIILVPSTFEHIKEIGTDGFRRVPKWGKTVSFHSTEVEYPYKGRIWRGKADVQDGKLCALLMLHPRYGLDFIAFSDDGGEADLLDSFFNKNQENGTVNCWLTDRDFVNEQGAAGHRTSKTFTEAVETYLSETKDRFR